MEIRLELDKKGRFRQESDLTAHIAKNLHRLEPGLTLYQEKHHPWVARSDACADRASPTGVEFQLPYPKCSAPPRIDVLAVDDQGGLVVIECKLHSAMHTVAGQVAAYVAILREALQPTTKRIRAFIVCRTASRLLWYALREIPDIEFKVFRYEGTEELKELHSPLGRTQLRLSM